MKDLEFQDVQLPLPSEVHAEAASRDPRRRRPPSDDGLAASGKGQFHAKSLASASSSLMPSTLCEFRAEPTAASGIWVFLNLGGVVFVAGQRHALSVSRAGYSRPTQSRPRDRLIYGFSPAFPRLPTRLPPTPGLSHRARVEPILAGAGNWFL